MFNLRIETENEAFADDGKALEVGRILRIIAIKVLSGQESGHCIDANGNNVGEWRFEEE